MVLFRIRTFFSFRNICQQKLFLSYVPQIGYSVALCCGGVVLENKAKRPKRVVHYFLSFSSFVLLVLQPIQELWTLEIPPETDDKLSCFFLEEV